MAQAQDESDWEYQLTPYLWSANIDGTQAVAGREFDVDASASDLIEFLDTALAARFEARNPRWGWFADGFYTKLSDEQNLPAGTLDGSVKQTILEGGFSYRFSEVLEGLAGLRYQKVDTRLRFSGLGSVSSDTDWTDGFVGLRWSSRPMGKWRTWLRGDIGAGDSDLIWNATVGGEYQFNDTVSLVAAYRYMDTDFEEGGFKWDMVMHGLGLGLGISW